MESKQKISQAMSGSNHPLYGIPVSSERKQKISNSLIGHIPSIETKKKISKNMKKRLISLPERLIQTVLSVNSIIYESQKYIELETSGHRVDIFIKPNICVNIDGCYWHGCIRCFGSRILSWSIQSNNKKRDQLVDTELKNRGYEVIRIWEHQVFISPLRCLQMIIGDRDNLE